MSKRFEGDDVVLAFIAQGERAALFDGDLRTRDGVVEAAADDHLVFPVFDLLTDDGDDASVREGELLGWEIRPLTDEEYDRRERDRELAADPGLPGPALAGILAVLVVLGVAALGWGYLELVWWLETRKP